MLEWVQQDDGINNYTNANLAENRTALNTCNLHHKLQVSANPTSLSLIPIIVSRCCLWIL